MDLITTAAAMWPVIAVLAACGAVGTAFARSAVAEAVVRLVQAQLPERAVEVGRLLAHQPRPQPITIVGGIALEPCVEHAPRGREVGAADPVEERVRRLLGTPVIVVVAPAIIEERKRAHPAKRARPGGNYGRDRGRRA